MKIKQRLSPQRILEASEYIHPVFLNTPYVYAGEIGDPLEIELYLKVETLNPLRSFKGRGCDYFFSKLPEGDIEIVCASVGNFGQGIAYAACEKKYPVTIFSSIHANPLKIERMQRLGAHVIQRGVDFEEAKLEAMEYARGRNCCFVGDGASREISEGAGTVGVEIVRMGRVDYVVIPLGNGSLINGMGTYFKYAMPETKVIGVVAEGAPSFLRSHESHKVVATEKVSTIADGIAIRKPIEEAFWDMEAVVDEIWEVSDEEIIDAMRALAFKSALIAEPAGAVSLAGVIRNHSKLKNLKVAAVVTGANITEEQFQNLLTRA